MERNRRIYDLLWCGECGCHLPVFRDLAPADQERLDEAASDAQRRYRTVAEVTGLSEELAKAWCQHRDKEIHRRGKWNSTPCPHCGRWLRSPTAQQCFHCGTDWHDPSAKRPGRSEAEIDRPIEKQRIKRPAADRCSPSPTRRAWRPLCALIATVGSMGLLLAWALLLPVNVGWRSFGSSVIGISGGAVGWYWISVTPDLEPDAFAALLSRAEPFAIWWPAVSRTGVLAPLWMFSLVLFLAALVLLRPRGKPKRRSAS